MVVVNSASSPHQAQSINLRRDYHNKCRQNTRVQWRMGAMARFSLGKRVWWALFSSLGGQVQWRDSVGVWQRGVRLNDANRQQEVGKDV